MKLRKYYLRGVGVGLVIGWVTGLLASSLSSAGANVILRDLIILEFVVSIIMLAASIMVKE
jgi:NhaP-type Na+/H+ or K+/H+ antiporter